MATNTQRDEKLNLLPIAVVTASSLMASSDAVRMAELKAEYCKLSTTAKRMKEIYAEMTALRSKVVL